jgi:hypothetical protein
MQLISNTRRAAIAAAAIAIVACAAKRDPSTSSSEADKPAPAPSRYRGPEETETQAKRGDKVAQGQSRDANNKADEKPDIPGHEAGRKVIRNGRVDIIVPAYEDARAKLDALVTEVGGYVDSTQVSREQGSSSSAVVVLRVPSASFATFIPKLRELGDVRNESTAGQDITDEYVDVAARLASAQALEKRLLELAAAKTGTIDQVLAVERELARVRAEIEGYQGHMRLWDDRVAMSTLTVDMSTKQPEIAAAAAPTLGERVTSTFHASIASLREFGSWLVVNGIALLPWLVLIAPALLILRKLARRVKLPAAIAKRAAAPDSPAA